MIGRQAVEAALRNCTVTGSIDYDAAERAILQFAIKDIDDLTERMEQLVGLRLIDAIADPGANASIINSGMRWLETRKNTNDQPNINPQAAAIENARSAMKEGGKLPELDLYAEDPT